MSHDPAARIQAPGAKIWYGLAVVAASTAMNTGWRFFADVLHVGGTIERVGLLVVLGCVLFACGWSMRAGVRRRDTPGLSAAPAWILCGLITCAGVAVFGPAMGFVRAALGPLLALSALYLTLPVSVGARSVVAARAGENKQAPKDPQRPADPGRIPSGGRPTVSPAMPTDGGVPQ